MRRKRLIGFWIVLVAMLIVACGRPANGNKATIKPTQTTTEKKKMIPINNNKSLIVYFSLSGNTKEAAQVIQKDTGADIFRLTAKDPYPADYDDYAKRGDYERRHQIHPAIKNRILDWDKYQVIYLGFPTWWQQPPMIIHTLFDDYSFAGKTIVPFTTSMSTPMADSMPYIRKMAAKDHAQVVPGYRYDGDKQGMCKWLQREHLLEK